MDPTKAPETAFLIDYKHVCTMLSVGKNAFFNMRQTGRFPIPSIRLGRAVRYNRRHVEQWIDEGCPTSWRAGR